MFKTETHLHVSEISPCSKINASEMVALYHEAGYKTIFVSDHFKQIYFDALGDIAWQDKVTIFLSGYYRAKAAAKKFGMNVLMSAELLFEGNPNHYLVYGITKEFLDSYPDLCKLSVEEFYEIAKKHNVFVVQAHPFRDGNCFPTPNSVDAFEVYNANQRHKDFSEKSEESAIQNGLYMTAGSDTHRLEDVAKGGVLTVTEIKSAEDYISLVKSGKIELFRG